MATPTEEQMNDPRFRRWLSEAYRRWLDRPRRVIETERAECRAGNLPCICVDPMDRCDPRDRVFLNFKF